MLVLSRRNGSSVKIGSDVKVTVLSVRGQQVRLGIQAPEDVRILRDELESEPEGTPPPAERTREAGMRIVLVIEDDPLHAKLIRKVLCQNQGTMVTVADTARRGLDALGALAGGEQGVQPDLILLDMRLPDGTGLDVLKAIRKEQHLRATPVVMLTCCQEDSVVKQCVDTGANAYVVKSPRWNEFRDSVNRIGQFWTSNHVAPKNGGWRASGTTSPAQFATGR